MGVFAVDLSVFPKSVLEAMHKIWTDENAVAMVEAKVRQEKAAKFYQDNAPRWKDGFGEMIMAIDPYWRDYFRMKYGADADTPEFQKWLLKQEGMFKVKAVAPRPMVGSRKSYTESAAGGVGGGKAKPTKESGTRGARPSVVVGAAISNRRERVSYGSR